MFSRDDGPVVCIVLVPIYIYNIYIYYKRTVHVADQAILATTVQEDKLELSQYYLLVCRSKLNMSFYKYCM